MDLAVNVPTSVGSSQYSMLAFADEISWESQQTFGKEIEKLGFDGLAVPDHLMTGDGQGTSECISIVAALAAVTDDVYLYPKTFNNHLRHGPLLAKTAATIDDISDGRLKLGIGAGWYEEEAVAYGYSWPDAPTRLREMEETIELMKQLWTGTKVEFHGDFYDLRGAVCKPRPVQKPHPPIMIGGGGEEFTLRIAAKHADCWNYWGSTDVIKRKLNVLQSHCNTYGTDYNTIQKSWFARCAVRESKEEIDAILDKADRFQEKNLEKEEQHLIGTPAEVTETIKEYTAMGIDEVVVEFIDFPRSESAELFADEVAPAIQ